MDEFTEGSRQLEAELEASLEQKEKLCRDLTAASQQLQKENESLYVSFEAYIFVGESIIEFHIGNVYLYI